MRAAEMRLDVVFRVDDQEVHRSHVATGANRGPKREDGPADHLSPRFRDEDARLGEVDQLAEQGCRVHRAVVPGAAEPTRRSTRRDGRCP